MTPKTRSKPALVTHEGKKVHPLVFVRLTCDMRRVAKALGHKNHTTFSIYASKARKSKLAVVPAEWCLPLAGITGLAPATFRPDLYLSSWTVDTVNGKA